MLRRLLLRSDAELWCARHRRDVPLSDPRLHVVDLDLEGDVSESLAGTSFDLVVHFAGVTHESDEARYWQINREGTVRLAEAVRANGCRRFVYISTRCATPGSGAYGESKLAAEQALQKFGWESLLIVRPAEIYGGGGKEGIDAMLALARRWRVAPALCGDGRLRFAPLHVDDFSTALVELIEQHTHGVRIESVCGPEDLSGLTLANRIAKRYRAVPLPLWWPAVAVVLKALNMIGLDVVKRDQLTRLVSEKTGTAASEQNVREGVRRFLAE